MLAAVQQPPAADQGFRFDVLGIVLMIVGLALGVFTRFLVPDAEECRSVSVWAAPTLAASVLAFGFGFARCLPERLRRGVTLAMFLLTPFAIILAIIGVLARPEVMPGACI